MHNKDKYPEIYAVKIAAQEELAVIMDARKVHTDAMKIVQGKIAKLRDEKSTLNDLAMIDVDRIIELNSIIARTALAMGAQHN